MAQTTSGSARQQDETSAPLYRQSTPLHTDAEGFERGTNLSLTSLKRYARRHLGFLAGLVIVAVATGIAYRYLFDPVEEREPAFYLRSCLHATGLALAGWTAYVALAAAPRSRLLSALRRLPQTAELAVKVLAMTAVLTIVAVGLQLVLYPFPVREHWLVHDLPTIVAIAFSVSLVAGAIFEFRRLVGGRVLGSFLLGTYHRPRREQRIVMFLDLAGSTALAEQMGELRVHDLITRFFFDIDRPIADHDGEVHAYVGDQVIVTWPLSDDPKRNARSLSCFFAAEDRIAELAPAYMREFGIAPQFRAGIHAGPVVVSECGDAKRQIAYFGDTMNVAARLCDHAKVAGEVLMASTQMLKSAAIAHELTVGSLETITLRGRQTPVEANAVRRETKSAGLLPEADMPDPINPRLGGDQLVARILAQHPGLTLDEAIEHLAYHGYDVPPELRRRLQRERPTDSQ